MKALYVFALWLANVAATIVIYALVIIVFLLAFAAAQGFVLQTFHDSCRYWQEPPPWARLCPPSTPNRSKHT